MTRIRSRKLLLGAALVAPFLVIADTPPAPPATSDAACCNLGTAFVNSIFPGGNGDEGFFGLPVGAPANAMIMLDNSGSMTEFPNGLPTVSLTSGTGTCTGTFLNDHTAKMTDTPYDNGASSTFLTDDPPWGLNRCTGANSCLFKGSSYYRYRDWTTNSATEYSAGSANSGQICYQAGDPAECQTCLDTAGYYLFRTTGGTNRQAFKGSFLNGYPPKFVVARKVVKDLMWIDPAIPDQTASVRFGLTIFTNGGSGSRTNGLQAQDGGILVVPLGPNCDNAVAGFQPANTTVSAAYQATRQAIINAVNDPVLIDFNGMTPLGETLFNMGQYFSDTRGSVAWPTTGSTGPVYDYMFGTQWTRSNFWETSAGTANVSWATGGRQASVCWACQQNTIVIVTDGEPTNDSNLPKYNLSTNHITGPTPGTAATSNNNDFPRWTLPALTVPCGSLSGCTSYILQKVAYFLSHNDMRPDLSNARQTQTVTTFAVSFGIQPTDAGNRRALALLDWTAQLGGGKFYNTSSGDELRNALYDAVNATVARATSFSVSNTNTLQTGSANQLFLARFRKLVGPAWEGHLTRFKIFNEFVQGCDKDKSTAAQTLVTCGSKQLNPNLDGDQDCNAKAVCDGLFILDAECDPVAEDENGDFRKARLVSGKFVATTTDAAAVPYWDAGENLSYDVFPATHPDPAKAGQANSAFRAADEHANNKRVIYTVVDSNADGKFTAADQRIPFEADWASWIAPYLELNGGRTVGTETVNSCVSVLSRAGFCGELPLPACPVPDATGKVGATDLELCARQVIHWVRGWDVFDEDGDGCSGPANPGNDPVACPNGEERLRSADGRTDKEFWKLGDIFHSSPVLVKPPATEMICDLGLENQCVATLHSPKGFGSTLQTPADFDVDGDGSIDPGEDAYEKYRRDKAQRRQVVLVGANDGLLHAFDAGEVDPSVPPDWLGSYTYTQGDGAELWAFVPPDLLPKLKLAISDHQYFVDGNTMVRDVWVDDNLDGTKQPGEYRTMAVVSERSGGSQYLGLDVTDTLDPVFRWTFPENCTIDQNVVAQSWSGFAPRPPPVGPVKLRNRAGGPADPTARGFEERWIVMVNGGYDPTLTRGRGVWMLDVWTGKPVWRFTNDEFKTQFGNAGALWPVPAAVGMVDIGTADQPILDADGFFDTATWGDMGGQIFVARFQEPGRITCPTCLVDNWFAARAFEEQRQTTDEQGFSGRTEFFFMTANAIDLDRGYLHSYVGGGNREHLLQVGAACGPGNILACCQAGCNAEMTTHYDYASCNVVNHTMCANGKMVQDATNVSGSCGEPYTCGKVDATVHLHLQCGAAGNPPDIIARLTCDSTGNCTTKTDVKDSKPVRTDRLTAPDWHNRFYGVYTYGGQSRTFTDGAGALALDANRFTDVTYPDACVGAASCSLVDTTYATVNASGAVTCPVGVTRCSASGDDPGWFYEYGRSCPSGTCDDPVPWLDEKTASGATILAGCVDWNTFRPRGMEATGTDPCSSGNTGAARNYTYLSDFVSGAPSTTCGYQYSAGVACTPSTEYVRARQRSTIAPPPDPTQLVAIGMDGEVKYMAAQIEPGGTPTTTAMGAERELIQPAYWLELNREQHVCRHVQPNACR
jgi:type IV pilus assembly protein PilY1